MRTIVRIATLALVCCLASGHISLVDPLVSLDALAASVRTAPAPNVWARLHRMLAFGPRQEDVAFTFRHARPPTTLTPFPHYFDSEDDEEAALTDLSEAHAAQVTMSLVALVGSKASFTVGGVAHTVHDLVRGEQARPAHAGVVRQIEAFAIDRCPLPDQSQRDAPMRRYELSRLDLTWVIEMSALDAYDRGVPLLAAWTDATGTRVALADLLRAQMRLYEINRQCGAPGFLPERGIHTVGMLLRIAGLLRRDASRGASSPRPQMQRVLADDVDDRGRRWLDESARALTTLAAPNAMDQNMAAHVLEIGTCPGDAVNAPVLSAATRDTLRQRLVTYLTAVAPKAPFSLATHALHAFGAASQSPATPAARYPCASF